MDKIHNIDLGGTSAIVATAIHNGHEARPEINSRFALNDTERLKEEDPYTDIWTRIAETRIIGLHTRFEVDLNRSRDKAIYIKPEDAWGLQVWNTPLDSREITKSLQAYDDFYSAVHELFEALTQNCKHIVVLDLHSYNHRRTGAGEPAADPEFNPEVNVGTQYMNHPKWRSIINRFIHDMQFFDFEDRHLDVRENIKFKGGYFQQWTYEHFPESVCMLSVEFKKIFMDEWSGTLDHSMHQKIFDSLKSTVPGIKDQLYKLDKQYD